LDFLSRKISILLINTRKELLILKMLLFSAVLLLLGSMLTRGITWEKIKPLKSGYTDKKTEADSTLYCKWILKKINGADVVKEKAGEQIPYIKFHSKDNELAGNTGCNDVNGKALITGDEITFSDMSMTKINCMDAEYETDYAEILFYKEPLKYNINNGILAIFKDGIEVMSLEKSD
jgi:heat shock protein HslJ